jgi:signal transduction histidine kinase
MTVGPRSAVDRDAEVTQMQLTPTSVPPHRRRHSHAMALRARRIHETRQRLLPPDEDGPSVPIAVRGPELVEALAHELRTPMTTIYGGAQVLAKNDRLSNATRDEVVNAVAEEAERLRRLVDDLLVVADAQARTALPRDPVLVQRVATKLIREMVEGKPGLKIRTVLPGDTPAVTGDPEAVRHAIRNLVGAAVAANAGRAPVEVVLQHGNGWVLIHVFDRGGALSSRSAFDPLQPSRSIRPEPGSLLGLAATRVLIAAMGGRSWARPRRGGGAEYGLALRIHREDLQLN